MAAIDILRTALSLPQKNTYLVVDSNDRTCTVKSTDIASALREGSKELRAHEQQCKARKIK